MAIHYKDRYLTCDEDGLTIRRYYFPNGDRRILYSEIRAIRPLEMKLLSGRLRIWGTGDLTHWFHLDTNRPFKHRALEIDLGCKVKPVVTPDDPDALERLLRERVPSAWGEHGA
jgi:hypothetical protein